MKLSRLADQVLPALCLCELLTSPPDALSPSLVPRIAERLLEHIYQRENDSLLEFFFKKLAHRQKRQRETAKRALSVLILTLWAWNQPGVSTTFFGPGSSLSSLLLLLPGETNPQF